MEKSSKTTNGGKGVLYFLLGLFMMYLIGEFIYISDLLHRSIFFLSVAAIVALCWKSPPKISFFSNKYFTSAVVVMCVYYGLNLDLTKSDKFLHRIDSVKIDPNAPIVVHPYQPSNAKIKAAKKAASEKKTQQFLWMENTKDAVRAKLKDAKSAQFRNVFFKETGGVQAVCGEVNSKNSFGAYGGFQKFVGNSNYLVYLEEEVTDFAQVWNKQCAQ